MVTKNTTRKKSSIKVIKKSLEQLKAVTSREQMEIHAKPEVAAGNYCNLAVFKHTKREFIVDFIWRVDNTSLLVSRIITSPQHAKAIHDALGKNIENYEKTYGDIKED